MCVINFVLRAGAEEVPFLFVLNICNYRAIRKKTVQYSERMSSFYPPLDSMNVPLMYVNWYRALVCVKVCKVVLAVCGSLDLSGLVVKRLKDCRSERCYILFCKTAI